MTVSVGDLVCHLDAEVPFAWAESWDRVGLLAGDPTRRLARVYVTLDATRSSLQRALQAGADILLTHHPAFLQSFDRLTWTGAPTDVALDALQAGVALVACHTNLDRAPRGADALPAALGLEVLGPLERGSEEVATVVVYAPADAADRVRQAMAAAGAGRIGEYEACAFVGPGRGSFTPLEGARPVVGSGGQETAIDEQRVEMVCAPSIEASVVAAARAAHPYDEPVVLTGRCGLSRGAARMGRLCRPTATLDLRGLAALVGERLGVRCTVWGDAERQVDTIGVAQGSGRSLLVDAVDAGADTFVTGELRYHEALDAVQAGLAIIEAGHDATEWPLTAELADIARGMDGLAKDAVVVDEPARLWWTT